MIPGAGHVDLYDRVDLIPFDTLATFFQNRPLLDMRFDIAAGLP